MRFFLFILAAVCTFGASRVYSSDTSTATAPTANATPTVDPLDSPYSFDEVAAIQSATVVQDDNGWSFTIEPYLWALGMSGDVGVKGLPAVNVDFSALDILRHLDWAVMGKAEIRKGRWGVLGDGLFAQLSANTSTPGPLYSGTNLRIQQGMASLAIAYRIIDDRRGFLDVYAGARYNYLGFQLNLSADSEGIQQASDAVAQRITDGVSERVVGFLAANQDAIVSQVQDAVQQAVTTKALEKMAAFPDDVVASINRVKLVRVLNNLRANSEEYRALVSATAQVKVAAAQSTASSVGDQAVAAAQQQVNKAQKKLAKAIAKALEDNLPSSVEGNQWWVDPMVGLRAQVNITRWLFLAIQGDVGGFGAGSNIAWNAQGSLGVNLTRHLYAEAGWRYFYMDYARDGAIYNAAEFGLFSGVGVRF